MPDTRKIFQGDPFLSDERAKQRMEGLKDAYLSGIMDIPMSVLTLLAPDSGYTPGELRSSPQDRLKGEMLAWELHRKGRRENPDYATGEDLGTKASYVADPFFDIPGVAAARLATAGNALAALAPRNVMGTMGRKLADEAGLFTLYEGPESALKGQFSALHDRVPRVEIDDSAAEFTDKFYGEMATGDTRLLSLPDVLDHPALYEASPEMRNVGVMATAGESMGGAKGSYSNSLVNLSDYHINDRDAQDTLLHEIQHALQERGGMARGGSPERVAMLRGDYDYAKQKLSELRSKVSPEDVYAEMKRRPGRGYDQYFAELMDPQTREEFDRWSEVIKEYDAAGMATAPRDPQEAYRRMAGEIEARDAAARRNMTAEERRRVQPFSSENIPLDDFIVRRGEDVSF